MIRTGVRATASSRPEWSRLSSQARAVPEYVTVTAGPLAARNFLVRSKHRTTGAREERIRGTGIGAQVKAAIVRFFIQRIKTRKVKDALHGLAETVEWVGDRLAAPLIVAGGGAQIVDLYDDGVAERARVRGRVRVIVRRDLEAASASAPSSPVGTKRELVDRCGIPIHYLATRYESRGRSRSVSVGQP